MECADSPIRASDIDLGSCHTARFFFAVRKEIETSVLEPKKNVSFAFGAEGAEKIFGVLKGFFIDFIRQIICFLFSQMMITHTIGTEFAKFSAAQLSPSRKLSV